MRFILDSLLKQLLEPLNTGMILSIFLMFYYIDPEGAHLQLALKWKTLCQ